MSSRIVLALVFALVAMIGAWYLDSLGVDLLSLEQWSNLVNNVAMQPGRFHWTIVASVLSVLGGIVGIVGTIVSGLFRQETVVFDQVKVSATGRGWDRAKIKDAVDRGTVVDDHQGHRDGHLIDDEDVYGLKRRGGESAFDLGHSPVVTQEQVHVQAVEKAEPVSQHQGAEKSGSGNEKSIARRISQGGRWAASALKSAAEGFAARSKANAEKAKLRRDAQARLRVDPPIAGGHLRTEGRSDLEWTTRAIEWYAIWSATAPGDRSTKLYDEAATLDRMLGSSGKGRLVELYNAQGYNAVRAIGAASQVSGKVIGVRQSHTLAQPIEPPSLEDLRESKEEPPTVPVPDGVTVRADHDEELDAALRGEAPTRDRLYHGEGGDKALLETGQNWHDMGDDAAINPFGDQRSVPVQAAGDDGTGPVTILDDLGGGPDLELSRDGKLMAVMSTVFARSTDREIDFEEGEDERASLTVPDEDIDNALGRIAPERLRRLLGGKGEMKAVPIPVAEPETAAPSNKLLASLEHFVDLAVQYQKKALAWEKLGEQPPADMATAELREAFLVKVATTIVSLRDALGEDDVAQFMTGNEGTERAAWVRGYADVVVRSLTSDEGRERVRKMIADERKAVELEAVIGGTKEVPAATGQVFVDVSYEEHAERIHEAIKAYKKVTAGPFTQFYHRVEMTLETENSFVKRLMDVAIGDLTVKGQETGSSRPFEVNVIGILFVVVPKGTWRLEQSGAIGPDEDKLVLVGTADRQGQAIHMRDRNIPIWREWASARGHEPRCSIHLVMEEGARFDSDLPEADARKAVNEMIKSTANCTVRFKPYEQKEWEFIRNELGFVGSAKNPAPTA